MKKLKRYSALIIVAMLGLANNIVAQANNKIGVPEIVVSSFTAKYPKAEVKNWNIIDNEYVSKAKENASVFYVTFDKKGQWVQTSTQIKWSRNLPAEIKATLKASKYAAWRVDKIRKVETPTGDSYQVLVDNTTLQIDQAHLDLADNLVLNFSPSGELSGTKSVSSALLF